MTVPDVFGLHQKDTEKGEDSWREYRRAAHYYERSLIRIRDATAVSASDLRDFAAQALAHVRRKKTRQTSAKQAT